MYIGIDLGGTNIAVGLVSEDGKIIKQDMAPTLAGRSYQEIVADMMKLSEKVTKEAGFDMSAVKGFGVGCPGAVDNAEGVLINAENLRIYEAPIAEEIKKYYDKPVALENDANAAAYAEYMVSGDNVDSFVAVTLGTGVGGGIILNKKIYRGFNGASGEIGHTALIHGGLPCSCGRCGCWETYASVTALVNQTKVAMHKHPESLMNTVAKERGVINGRTAFDAAKMGDKVGIQVVETYTKYVADGIVNIINIFQPKKLVIGGGISKEGDYLIKPIIEYAKKYDYNKYREKTEITTATLFNDAGIIGAALAAAAYEG